MRVLLLGSYLPPRGGAETHLADVERLLRAAGQEVELHAAPPPAGRAGEWLDRFHSRAVATLVAERLRAFRPDVVHVHNFLRRLSTAPFRVAARAGVPTVLTLHDYQLTCPRTWALRADGRPCPSPSLPLCLFGNCRGGEVGLRGRAIYAANTLRVRLAARCVRRRVARILAPSQALALRASRVLRREVVHLPYPFPSAVADVGAVPASLLFLGRIAAEKGVLSLLAAVAAARRQGAAVTLTIAGDGPALPAVRAQVAALGLADVVRLRGWVAAADVPALLREHGALVLPSLWVENFPVSVQEALAAGRPVLGSRRGGIPELVVDGHSGLLFEPRDLTDFAGALVRWSGLDPAARAAMASAARDGVAAVGDPVHFGTRLLGEYRTAVARGAARP